MNKSKKKLAELDWLTGGVCVEKKYKEWHNAIGVARHVKSSSASTHPRTPTEKLLL